MEPERLHGPASETNVIVKGSVREAWNTFPAAFNGLTLKNDNKLSAYVRLWMCIF